MKSFDAWIYWQKIPLRTCLSKTRYVAIYFLIILPVMCHCQPNSNPRNHSFSTRWRVQQCNYELTRWLWHFVRMKWNRLAFLFLCLSFCLFVSLFVCLPFNISISFSVCVCLFSVCDIWWKLQLHAQDPMSSCPSSPPNAFHCLAPSTLSSTKSFKSTLKQVFSRNFKLKRMFQMKVLPSRMLISGCCSDAVDGIMTCSGKMHPGLSGNLWIPMLYFLSLFVGLFVCFSAYSC